MIPLDHIERLLGDLVTVGTVITAARWAWKRAKQPLMDLEACKAAIERLEAGQKRILRALKLESGHAAGD